MLPSSRRLRAIAAAVDRRHFDAKTDSCPCTTSSAAETEGEGAIELSLMPLSEAVVRPELSFGAEVADFDLREFADSGLGTAVLYDALVRHGVLIFRDQHLTEDQEIMLAQRFPHNADFRPPALEYLGNTDKKGKRLEQFVRGGRYWHVDGSQNALPMVMTWISAADRATVQCGNSSTLFASGVRALEVLPAAERELDHRV